MSAAARAIPAVAHFVWYGERFPWVNVLAVRSAIERGGFEHVVLHHDRNLSETPFWAELARLPRFEARRLDPREVFRQSGGDAHALQALHARLVSASARANVVRAAVLAGEGGVYLDMDTVTLRPMTAMLVAGAFCGEEHLVFPARVRRSLAPSTSLRAWLQTGVRDVLRRVPGGWRTFRRIERRYPRAVNNAVLGSRAGHPFVTGLLEAMAALPPGRRLVRYALGTHLLQDRVAAYVADDLVVHSPRAFYPLPPEISEHWFRPALVPALGEVVFPETRVVHWYASVRTERVTPAIDPEYVRGHACRQLFSALAFPFVASWYGCRDETTLWRPRDMGSRARPM